MQNDDDIARCSYKLLESTLFAAQKDYVRRQIVYGLLQVLPVKHQNVARLIDNPPQEDAADVLLLLTSFLLLDGRQNESTFEMMNEEGIFLRLLELIQSIKDGDFGLHRMLLELLYEMSRIQRLRIEDLSGYPSCPGPVHLALNTKIWLAQIEDEFVIYLLQIIESLSDDANDPYHYPVIRVLVRLLSLWSMI